ncbi:MAG: hypothetical protein AVDCRST_MAG88-465 [uncultured Thermomicrobiales bacterium]|uniref:Uncharacterized protein n=1 Tax=uncultured Thermomicrobiales bacterium TaxID=1645740 RepID=A0A6J4UC24_9BACT|nr:MAG: hypothetical protein AVDCRST_MAG88-465 [uncultured Thermomicrobiales bacterium]
MKFTERSGAGTIWYGNDDGSRGHRRGEMDQRSSLTVPLTG